MDSVRFIHISMTQVLYLSYMSSLVGGDLKTYSLKEAAQILGVSVRSLQRWDKQGIIKCIKTPRGRRKLPESELKRLLQDMRKTKNVKVEKLSCKEEKNSGKLEIKDEITEGNNTCKELDKLKEKYLELQIRYEELRKENERLWKWIKTVFVLVCPNCQNKIFSNILKLSVAEKLSKHNSPIRLPL